MLSWIPRHNPKVSGGSFAKFNTVNDVSNAKQEISRSTQERRNQIPGEFPRLNSTSPTSSPKSVISSRSNLGLICEEDGETKDRQQEQVHLTESSIRERDQTNKDLKKRNNDMQIDLEHRNDDNDDVAESSVFGGLVDSTISATATTTTSDQPRFVPMPPPKTNHHHNDNDNVYQIQQSQMKRVLYKAACQMKQQGGRTEHTANTSKANKLHEITANNDTKGSTLLGNNESTDNSSLGIKSVRDTVRSMEAVNKGNLTLLRDREKTNDGIGMSTDTNCSNNNNKNRQGQQQTIQTLHPMLLGVHRDQVKMSATTFQRASQVLQDDLDRAQTLVQTLEEQLDRAYQRREEALLRYEEAHAKRKYQVMAESVQTLHLEIIQECCSSSVTREMIEGPMSSLSSSLMSWDGTFSSSSSNRIDHIKDLSAWKRAILQFKPSIATDNNNKSNSNNNNNNNNTVNHSQLSHDSGCTSSSNDSSSTWYQDLSLEELQLMKNRLENILGLFRSAQRRKESTNLQWQAQADLMKQDAASKYLLYCQYGRII
ncbi:hypothetical protein IV203_030611 [Nitzschia inconspicua]|uniref:Uncharacterized protein n=1 Tax=Nitzschia inconspicua TaxID=303405 RepID=A0A9K3KPX0_9STRA|nr:hypothetical protein IV203_015949 [Nitzschia inconspicua]KAG7367868.1 hypothetical protein IV203_030611 [Nitzschia inconspicua]